MTVLINRFYCRIELTRDMLGTNPINLDVHDKHILDRQRKIITEQSSINKAINKYLSAKQISEERGQLELNALYSRVEEFLGRTLNEEEKDALKDGDLKRLKEMKETFEELDEKGITCFFRNNHFDPNTKTERKDICIGSHMIMGFLKAATESISRTLKKKNGTIMHSASYTQSVINQHLSIFPDLLNSNKDIKRKDDRKPFYLQRPLRAMTPQGPRVSLAKSEVLPAGAVFEFTILLLKDSPIKEEHLKNLLSFGQLKGLGQWRNAGYGTFKVVEFIEMKETDKIPEPFTY